MIQELACSGHAEQQDFQEIHRKAIVDAFNPEVPETLELFSMELSKEADGPWRNSSPLAKRLLQIPVSSMFLELATQLVKESSFVNKIEFQDSIKVTVYQTVVADKF